MSQAEVSRLRRLIGEKISSGGSEGDTLFTDADLQVLIDEAPSVERAAYEAWREKAALLSSLVDTTEGNAQRKFSQLLDNALDMVKAYSRSSEGPTENRTRIGQIRREPIEW